MTLLQTIVKILIKIGSPVVKSIGKIILFFKKIKFKPIKIKLPNFSWPKIILSKWQIEKRQRNWLKLPKIRIPN
jgi:hypothetical protein